jgi:uncharacterized protein related to proFAR isomerase
MPKKKTTTKKPAEKPAPKPVKDADDKALEIVKDITKKEKAIKKLELGYVGATHGQLLEAIKKIQDKINEIIERS